MIIASIICFCLAAILGITLLVLILARKKIPSALAFFHGLFAASGLVLLIIYTAYYMENRLYAVTALFIVVALVGFYMLSRHLKNLYLSKSLAVLHGVVAVIALISLIYLFNTL
jgi:hypothetical protein